MSLAFIAFVQGCLGTWNAVRPRPSARSVTEKIVAAAASAEYRDRQTDMAAVVTRGRPNRRLTLRMLRRPRPATRPDLVETVRDDQKRLCKRSRLQFQRPYYKGS